MFYWGFGQIDTVWCLVKTIPTVHDTIYLWNKISISTYFLIAYVFYFLTLIDLSKVFWKFSYLVSVLDCYSDLLCSQETMLT